VSLAAHRRRCLLSQKEAGFEIGIKNVVPSVRRPISELCAVNGAGIGNQNV
jgi:hypothetical protein